MEKLIKSANGQWTLTDTETLNKAVPSKSKEDLEKGNRKHIPYGASGGSGKRFFCKECNSTHCSDELVHQRGTAGAKGIARNIKRVARTEGKQDIKDQIKDSKED